MKSLTWRQVAWTVVILACVTALVAGLLELGLFVFRELWGD